MNSIRRMIFALAFMVAPAAMTAAALNEPGAPLSQDFLTGQFLIAAPEMGDPRFYHAVILMVRHDKNGAFGLIVNRPVAREDMSQLLADLGQKGEDVKGSIEVYAGGPVEPELGFVLHSAEYSRPETLAVDGQVAMTASPGVLRDIAGKRGPEKFIFALGYAGWGPGQLEHEIELNAWFTAPDDPKLLFDDDPAKLWQDAVARRSRAL